MLREIERLGLVPAVSPIQYAIRLLIPQGSRMLELEDVRGADRAVRSGVADARVAASPTRAWTRCSSTLEQLVGSRLNAPRDEVFARVWDIAHDAAGLAPPPREPLLSRAAVPYLNEPWYC